MQKIDNLFVSELEFDDSGMRGPRGESGDAPSLHTRKIAPWLYDIDCSRMDIAKAETFVRKHYPDPVAACVAVAGAGLSGHNYDAPYDDTAEFIVKTPARNGRYGSVGMAIIPGVLTASMMDAGEETDDLKDALEVLPFFTVDGMNDAGVTVMMNHMPDEDTDQLSDDSGMCALFAVRYVLDHAGSVDEAATLLSEQTFWFPKNDNVKCWFYLLISDGSKALFSDLNGRQKMINLSDFAVLTNFRTIGWDGTHETLEKHANGIERYEIVSSGVENVHTESELIELLKSVRYTNAYDQEREDFWYSDYNGDWSALGYGDLTIDSAIEDYAQAIAYRSDLFEHRERNGETMQTIHTVVYDTENKMMIVLVQEEDDVYRLCMDEIALLNREIERAKNAENQIREDFANSFYYKSEVDDALSDLGESLMTQVAEDYYDTGETDEILEELHEDIAQETEDKLAEKLDIPSNDGEAGQVLYRKGNGSEWGDLPQKLPDVTEEQENYVLAVEGGTWVATDKFADYFRYVNITVQIVSDNGGVPSGGLTVTVKNTDTGDVINEAEYLGQPVTFRVPRGLAYRIEQSGVWEGYTNPTPDKIEGAATNDIAVVFTYEAIKIPETLRELQIIVDGGGASSLKNHIGLQFEDTYNEGDETHHIIWDLKDVIPVFDENGDQHTGVVLQWHYATPMAMPFDAAEREPVDLATHPVAQAGLYYYSQSGSTIKMLNLSAGDPLPTGYDAIYMNEVRSADANVIRRGYGCYAESAVRKWLNSNDVAGLWFESSHIGDVAPSQASDMDGFMHGCSEQILSMVKPIRVRTEWGEEFVDTYDRFFLPCVDQVYGSTNHNTDEGDPWQDWIDATGFDAPSNNACAGRKIYMIGSASAQEIGLRSANNAYQYIVWDIKSDGSIDGYVNASVARRYTPCCVVY